MDNLIIRPFRERDAAKTARLFYRSVHDGSRQHYDADQRHAWAPRIPEISGWLERLRPQTVCVAERDGGLMGFMTLAPGGLIDLAYVAPDAIGQGVGKALYAAILAAAEKQGMARLHAEASHLARPFFEQNGWSVLRPQTVDRGGVTLENFLMEKTLS